MRVEIDINYDCGILKESEALDLKKKLARRNIKLLNVWQGHNSPVTLCRIDLTYKKQMLFVNVRFMFFLCRVISRKMRLYSVTFVANPFQMLICLNIYYENMILTVYPN